MPATATRHFYDISTALEEAEAARAAPPFVHLVVDEGPLKLRLSIRSVARRLATLILQVKNFGWKRIAIGRKIVNSSTLLGILPRKSSTWGESLMLYSFASCYYLTGQFFIVVQIARAQSRQPYGNETQNVYPIVSSSPAFGPGTSPWQTLKGSQNPTMTVGRTRFKFLRCGSVLGQSQGTGTFPRAARGMTAGHVGIWG